MFAPGVAMVSASGCGRRCCGRLLRAIADRGSGDNRRRDRCLRLLVSVAAEETESDQKARGYRKHCTHVISSAAAAHAKIPTHFEANDPKRDKTFQAWLISTALQVRKTC